MPTINGLVIRALAISLAFLPATPAAHADSGKEEVLFASPDLQERDSALFPEPNGIKPNVYFWLDVYTKYYTNQVIIHDAEDLRIRYEVVNTDVAVGKNASRRTINRFLSKRKRHYRHILDRLARQGGKCQTREECRVAGLFGIQATPDAFRKASRNVRKQYGLADRFLTGLETSGLYLNEMKRIFKSYGLPTALVALPHVESSFNIKAYSKYGAAGIWQFTRSTGRLFMDINYTVDERRDPIKATHAAARLLKKNYETLGSWPLAITAYNHGRRGMERAKAKFGNDISTIVHNYNGRTFGFASRNFYSEFLAARRVAENPERFFGAVNFKLPLRYETVRLKHFLPAKLLSTHFGFSQSEMAYLNPDLRHSIWDGTRRIPRGYELKLPHGQKEHFEERYASAPKGQLFAGQIVPDYYTVRRGDTLSVIARKFKTTTSTLQAYNDLRSRHRIYAGQRLRIPPQGRSIRVASLNSDMDVMSKAVKPVVKRKVNVGDKTPRAPKDITRDINLPLQMPPIETFGFERLGRDYGVIRVKPDETLGHYSYWSGVSVRQIQRFNGWRWKRNIHLGGTIKIPLTVVNAKRFQQNRYEYHLGVFEDFFAAYKVDKVLETRVNRGDSLWSLTKDADDVPIWLVALYNDDTSLHNLKPGDRLHIPLVEKR